jgi:hypothetical protein
MAKIRINFIYGSGQQIAMEKKTQIFIKLKNFYFQFFEIEKPFILDFENFSKLKIFQTGFFQKCHFKHSFIK